MSTNINGTESRKFRDPITGRFAMGIDFITVELQNGQRTISTPINFLDHQMEVIVSEIFKVMESAARAGGERAFNVYSRFVAVKSGRMRDVFIDTMKGQILDMAVQEAVFAAAGLGGEITITIDLSEAINKVFYTLYHIFDFTGVRDYQNPNVPGTKPIDLREMSFLLTQHLTTAINRFLTSRGYEVMAGDILDLQELAVRSRAGIGSRGPM